jgi:hypothetical protein
VLHGTTDSLLLFAESFYGFSNSSKLAHVNSIFHHFRFYLGRRIFFSFFLFA